MCCKRLDVGRVLKACGLAACTCLSACGLKASGRGRVWKACGLAARTCLSAYVLNVFRRWKGLEGVRASSPHLPQRLCVESVWTSDVGRVWKACGLAARTCLSACASKAFGRWKGLEGVGASSPHLPQRLCVESVWTLEGFERRAG